MPKALVLKPSIPGAAPGGIEYGGVCHTQGVDGDSTVRVRGRLAPDRQRGAADEAAVHQQRAQLWQARVRVSFPRCAALAAA